MSSEMRDSMTSGDPIVPRPGGPTRRSGEETCRLGDAIYERDIRPLVEETHHGNIVAIDVDSESYAIADTVLGAAEQLRAQHPDADVWLLRIGYRALAHIGGSSLGWPR